MEKPGIPRIAQCILATILLTFVCLSFRFNQTGHNVINLTACAVLYAGLDNLIIYYRCLLENSSFETEGTFITFCFFTLGKIFENFNTSTPPLQQEKINQVCYYLVLAFLILNATYYVGILLILIGYLVRQIYRLMTETLLSTSTNIEREQLEVILNTRRPYREIKEANPSVNGVCSICLQEFEDDNMCIMLPGCKHCFNDECIEEWLNNKSTCPYCRHNIRLDLI